MRHCLVIGVIAAVLAAACTGDDGGAATPTTRPGDRVSVEVETSEGVGAGATATADELTAIEFLGFDGEPVTLARYAGRPLVVNLFASWCAPCVAEMPAIERVKQEVGDAVAFLGIAVNDRVEDALALIERTGITWDVARDPFGELTIELGAVRMPTTFIVSPEGEILEVHGGQIDEDELRALLDEHFGVAP